MDQSPAPDPRPNQPADEAARRQTDDAASQPSRGLWHDSVQPAIGKLFAAAAAMTQYYWSHAGDLWHYLVEVTPFLEATGDRERELRISKSDGLGAEAFDGDAWRLDFPDCCVVTGEPAAGPWIEETHAAPDMTGPFWGLVGGIAGGLLASYVFQSIWLWPVCIVAGMAIGYANRRTRDVTLRFRRSAAAADDDEFPSVRVFPGVLLVRVGSLAARKAVIQARIERETGMRGGVPLASGPAVGQPARPASDEPRPVPPEAPPARPAGEAIPSPKGRAELPPISLDDLE